MSNEINICAFKPELFSEKQITRLEILLDKLDEAAKERKLFLDTAQIIAMREWLKNPDVKTEPNEYLEIYNAIPDNIFCIYLEEEIKSIFGDQHKEVLKSLSSFPVARQKEAFIFMQTVYSNFTDKKENREASAKLSKLYKTILTEYPDILNNEDDILSAIKLGKSFKEHEESLTNIWQNSSMTEQIKKIKSLLAEAYPNDDVEKLYIGKAKAKKEVGAVFLPSKKTDVIICGPILSGGKEKTYDIGLFILSHEFQHRQQMRWVKKLENDKLEKGSAEYYQSRIYLATYKGGYLAPETNSGNIALFAGLKDYLEQPVEQQANNIATLSSMEGDTKGAKMWAFNEKLTKAFSIVAKPIDTAMFNIGRVTSTITSIRSNKAEQPKI